MYARNEFFSAQTYKVCHQIAGYLQSQVRQNAASGLEQYLETADGIVVQRRGPFSDTVFPSAEITNTTSLVSQLIGSYEAELHNVMQKISGNKYKQIINIGAGWGYYSVGLALQFPEAIIHAFELDGRKRLICRHVAKMNGINSRIELHDFCDITRLGKVLSGEGGFIFIDCEGCEKKLLDPYRLKELNNYDILVEVHDYNSAGPTMGEVLCDRFRHTHEITYINPQQRDSSNYPELNDVTQFASECLLREGRVYSRGWLYLWQRRVLTP